MRTYSVTFVDSEGRDAAATETFGDTDSTVDGFIGAQEWAEDWAYMMADKGAYVLTDITDGD